MKLGGVPLSTNATLALISDLEFVVGGKIKERVRI
jgi:hypothetical protein